MRLEVEDSARISSSACCRSKLCRRAALSPRPLPVLERHDVPGHKREAEHEQPARRAATTERSSTNSLAVPVPGLPSSAQGKRRGRAGEEKTAEEWVTRSSLTKESVEKTMWMMVRTTIVVSGVTVPIAAASAMPTSSCSHDGSLPILPNYPLGLGNLGSWVAEDQTHWTNYNWQRCNIRGFLGSWELDTLWKKLLVHILSFRH
ncbi:uncharacterized protein LOC100842667 isoform X1 [Brachypodium distachyon]|uniref:uncharacterized protein LOC100842667 isoform X1 n=1 Tax=Brachypodium distachyon TaxID=15368 RepID=UPI00071DA799|nr:uncharacterized protein LOC100842667 isoform X1 [Brachypodium distachyon]|eukprot:XP_014755748.1 uncharacterized protein LOC100842667 isoform X1 [Brachypodium distachyon]